MEDKSFIDKVQKRVAKQSIGFSTLRGQGSGEMPRIARTFLAKIKLDKLADMNSGQFMTWLNHETETLVKKFIKVEQKRNWGAARKSINIFLENAFYDRFLFNEYSLHKLESVLELPFDSNTREELVKDGKLKKVPHEWKTIKYLKKDAHEKFQKIATQVAEKKFKSSKHKARIYLDVYYWRNKVNNKD